MKNLVKLVNTFILQMNFAFSALESQPTAMIMGDFNFDAVKHQEEVFIDKNYTGILYCFIICIFKKQ